MVILRYSTHIEHMAPGLKLKFIVVIRIQINFPFLHRCETVKLLYSNIISHGYSKTQALHVAFVLNPGT